MSIDTFIERGELVARMPIATAIHITGDDGLKYRSKVVGYDSGVLMTSLPNVAQLPEVEDPLETYFAAETVLVMRLIVDGNIYAFSSKVRTVYSEGIKLLLSSLPEKVQTRQLRGGVRYPCVLEAGFVLGETKYRGVLINISEGGCLLRMKQSCDLENIKVLMENDKTSNLTVRFPFDSSDSSFDIKVKSLSQDAGYLLLGMFYADSEEAGAVIKRYLEYMQLQKLSEYLVLS
ncbi:MAG: hypothetical protein ACI9WS_001500 [Paraglaciecola psychrophila]|jgi:hypothetical protein